MTNLEKLELRRLTEAYIDARIGTFPEADYKRMKELEKKEEEEREEFRMMDIQRTRVW